MDALLGLRGICKSFSGVTVLENVDFDVRTGRVVALAGENGAGKSTLMKVVTGIHKPDSGIMTFKGRTAAFATPRAAMDGGIAIIHQELNLLPGMTVRENLVLGREPLGRFGLVDWDAVDAIAERSLARLKQAIDPRAPLGTLSIAQQQMVEIAKALSLNAEVIIMDEPTDSLTEVETDILFGVIRELRADGKGIVFISHRLGEIFRLCDEVAVLRDGRMVHQGPVADIDEDGLIRAMVGRELSDQYPYASAMPGAVRLRVADLSAPGIESISFEARAGEVVGFAGLVGAGRTELAKTLYGALPRRSGVVEIDGDPVRLGSPRDGVRAGVGYVTEDRKLEGLIQSHSLRDNLSLTGLFKFSGPGGLIDRARETAAVAEYRAAFAIKTVGLDMPVAQLSGGNQQKVSIAKSLLPRPRIVILDEPTRGVDVGAKREIYLLINRFKAEGLCVLLMSSDMPELLGVSDRILVLSHGRITGRFDRGEATQEGIMRCAVAA